MISPTSRATLEILSKTRVVVQGFSPPPSSSPSPSCSSAAIPTGYENGCYHRISHESTSTSTKMIFGLFLPSSYQNDASKNTPVMIWLSGLTCDDTNFAMKAGSTAFEAAERHGMAIVMPDTSPRHDEHVPNVDAYDFGIGAGFYINATKHPYTKHYHMYDYITKELPSILNHNLNIGKHNLKSISGHSMGGHGALTIALREGNTSWKSVSAFAPICNPTNCPWGKKAFQGYFSSPEEDGRSHDATCLVQSLDSSSSPAFDDILIDQGTADNFLETQLKPEALIKAAQKSGQQITMNMRAGFDHSYFFIAHFIKDHIDFHAKYLA